MVHNPGGDWNPGTTQPIVATNIGHLKGHFIFQPLIFRGYVSFRKGV